MNFFNRLENPYIALSIILLLAVNCQKKDDLAPMVRQNATLIYMIADNNLDYYAIQNINDLEKGLYNCFEKKQSIYVYIDRTKNKPILYNIVPDTLPLIRSKIEYAYPEINSCNKYNFRAILNDVISLTKSRNEDLNGLILWSHGSSWLPKGNRLISRKKDSNKNNITLNSFGIDAESNYCDDTSEMSLLDLSEALRDLHFKYLIFDACFMGAIEVVYELRNYFDFIIASPTEILASGFPYSDIVPFLGMERINYSKICDAYVKYYLQKRGVLNSASISVIKTSHLESFANEFQSIINKENLKIAFQNSIQYEISNSNILFDIAAVINTIKNINIRNELLLKISYIIEYYNHTDYFYNKIPLFNTSGLSMFIPNKTIENESIEFQFFKKTAWAKDSGLYNFYINN